MALRLTFNFNGLAVPDACLQVQQPSLLSGDRMVFTVAISVDMDQPPFFVGAYQCAYSVAGADPFTQAYNYLKSLAEYAGAVEVPQ